MRSAGGRSAASRPTKSDAPCGRELAIDEVMEGWTPKAWAEECERMAEVTIPENAEAKDEWRRRAAAVRRKYGIS